MKKNKETKDAFECNDDCTNCPYSDGNSKCTLEDVEDVGERFKKGKVEYRSVQLRASVLDAGEGQNVTKVLDGRPIVFDTPTLIYVDREGTQYFEQVHHDALEGVDLSNVFFKYNHSQHVPPLASTRAGTLDLVVDDKGMGITARMANTTSASDIHELVRSGNLEKMSFAFTVANDAYDCKTKTRTIFKFDKIFDVSVVDFPAYDDTTVTARNYFTAQQEAVKNIQKQEEEQRTKAEQRKKLLLKTY